MEHLKNFAVGLVACVVIFVIWLAPAAFVDDPAIVLWPFGAFIVYFVGFTVRDSLEQHRRRKQGKPFRRGMQWK